MVERLLSPRLADIVEAIERIRLILKGVSLEVFEQDWEKRWLVERGIEILSEASRHLPDDLKTRRPNIPWSKVAGIGNVLRHDYDPICAGRAVEARARRSSPFIWCLPRRTDCCASARRRR
jgi:uncharacterized protein with HEPN domain